MPDSGELIAGALVTPSIRLERLLGRGGMGSVWLAQHLQLRTQVVVKFMTAERAASPEAQQRFRREAELAALAKSPHVVQIFDHGVSQLGIPYIAMELLEGEDLGKRIAREGAIEPRRFADWLTQACRGLSRAHAKGIVHRDIKPENIFLCDNDGEILVKVLDFGVAKGGLDPSELLSTRTGAMLGTAYYMSPEQTMGKKDIDHRTDLWALAVVAFYALTGARPFNGDGIGPLVLSITTDPLPLLSEKNPALGPELDAWMTKALARAREARFQSSKELAESFAKAAGVAERQSSASGATSWPNGPVPPPVSDSGGLAASTMAPSVSSESLARRAISASAPSRRFPRWALPIGVGSLLGLSAVLALSGSPAADHEHPAAAASGLAGPVPPPASSAPSAPSPPAPHQLEPAPSTSLAVSEPSAKSRVTRARVHTAAAPNAPAPAPAANPTAAPPARPTAPANPLDMQIE